MFRQGPATYGMADLVAYLARLIGVPVDSRTVIHTGGAYTLQVPAEGMTIRDALAGIASAHGGNWIITPENRLRLVPIVSAAGASSATADAVDIMAITGGIDVHAAATVTGVRYTDDNLTVVLGSDSGLVLEGGLTAATANLLADAVIGSVYQAYSLTGAIYDPAAELGDYVRAGANSEVASVLYAETITLSPVPNGSISAPFAVELSDEYPYIGGNEKVLTAAKIYAAQQVAALDNALDQQDVFNRLTGNGVAQGIFLYDGQVYVSATYMNTGTLNATDVRIINLSADNITSGIIHSADYATEPHVKVYPAESLYPGAAVYPNYGETVISGFAIDFSTGQIYGGFYSESIADLDRRVTALENK
jgi:hypothetical protein